MTNGKIKYKKNHKIITPHQCLCRTRVNKVKIIHEFKKCLQNIQSIKIKCLKINKNKAPHKINHPQPWVHHPHHHYWTDDGA
jgi:hypothetical protein